MTNFPQKIYSFKISVKIQEDVGTINKKAKVGLKHKLLICTKCRLKQKLGINSTGQIICNLKTIGFRKDAFSKNKTKTMSNVNIPSVNIEFYVRHL